MIKKLDKNHWQELKEIRLEALQKSPDSFLASFEEEGRSPYKPTNFYKLGKASGSSSSLKGLQPYIK